MKANEPDDAYRANNYYCDLYFRNYAHEIFAVPCFFIKKAHAGICSISWKSLAMRSIRHAGNLLLKECIFLIGAARHSRTDCYCNNSGTTFMEKENAPLYRRRNNYLYALSTAGILTVLCSKKGLSCSDEQERSLILSLYNQHSSFDFRIIFCHR